MKRNKAKVPTIQSKYGKKVEFILKLLLVISPVFMLLLLLCHGKFQAI